MRIANLERAQALADAFSPDLREILSGCNQRYLAFLSSLDDPSAGERDLLRLSQRRVGAEPAVKGLNFFEDSDHRLLQVLQHGEFNIHGWRRADLSRFLSISPAALSRQLKQLRLLGVIKKVVHTYRYYLTRIGRAVIAAVNSHYTLPYHPFHGRYTLNSSQDLS